MEVLALAGLGVPQASEASGPRHQDVLISEGGDSSSAELVSMCGWRSMSRTSTAQFAKELQVPVES